MLLTLHHQNSVGRISIAAPWRPAHAVRIALMMALLGLAGCALFQPKSAPVAPPVSEPASPPRLVRALANLSEGLKRYEAGNFDEAKTNLLLAVDSGVLSTPQQINARKHMAFIYALQNREASAREEFEKAMALDSKFELTPAEAGHPAWGPVYRQVKTENANRRVGWLAPKPPTKAERLFGEGMVAYDSGDYAAAIKLFADVQKETISLAERIKTHKQTAFSYCLTKQTRLCRAEFGKILKLQPTFNLEPAEAGHPSWGATFREAQSTFKTTQKDASKISSPAPKK